MIKRKIFDLDDTLIDRYLKLVKGIEEFLKWSPEGNFLVTWAKHGNLWQEDKLTQTGLLKYFPTGRLIICPTPEEKKWHIERLVREAVADGCEVEEIAVMGDRPDIELAVAVELGCVPIRMVVPDGKYRDEPFEHPHYQAGDWHQVMKLPVFA